MKLTKFKQTALGVCLSIGLMAIGTPSATASGIPTFDAASVAQAIQQGIQLGEQIENQIKQIKELESQVKAITGTRNLGDIAKNVALDQVPEEWRSIYDDIKGLDTKTLTGKGQYSQSNAAEALINSYKQAAKAIGDTKARVDVINQLAQQINQSQDAKAAADLQNRISVEQSRIANNQVMLDMTMKMAEQQEKIQSAQQQSIIQCQIKAKSKTQQKECGSI